jgi:hypothetical protein
LRRWIVDDEATRFEASARRMAAAMEQDAPAWRALAPTVVESTRRQERREASFATTLASRWSALTIIACTLTVVGAATLWLRSNSETERQQPSAPMASGTANDGAIASGDVELLLALMGQSELALGALIDHVEMTAAPMMNPSRRQTLDAQVDAAVFFFAYRLPASTAKVAGLERASATIASPNLNLKIWSTDRGA